MRRGSTVLTIALVWGGLAMTPAAAQEDIAPDRAPTDSVTVVAGPEYEAGPLHRALLGARYRDSWTVPVRVPVLDLSRFGGLTPVQRGGGVQTRTLRFEAPDGREYNFRSINKTYRHSVPDWARGTLVEWLRQDQTSAQHPGAALVATPLLESSGLLHPDPQLYVMPDDPRLGEFREEFAGLLGTLEHHPNEGENDRPLFAGAPKVAGGDRVLEHLDEEPEHRLATEEFLTERLMSIFIGDWDRHIGQYRFARYERDGIYRWVPIPEDRDYAFVEHDGILPGIARTALTARLITYESRYQDLHAMLSNSADLVRRLLAPLDRAAWDSVAQAVYASLTDENIDQAIAALPMEWQEQTGSDLAEVMRARRDRFLDMSDDFYEMMAAYPEVHATDEEEEVIIERHEDASVTVRVYAPENEAWGDEPYFERRFLPNETREIRIFLAGDDDRAVVRGPAGDSDERIAVRVVGGEGDDVLADSSGHVYLYDARGDNEFVAGPGTHVDTSPYVPPAEPPSLLPNKPRDWGRARSLFSPAVSWVPDVGFMIGGGPVWTRYGFRHDPFASQHSLAALVNPGSWRGALVYSGTLRPANSPRRVEIGARASNSGIVRFHGFGNSTPALPDAAALTWYRRYDATGSLHIPWGTTGEMLMGAGVHYVDAELEADTRLGEVAPFGTAGLGEAGVRAGLSRDTRDDAAFPRRGTTASVEIAGYMPLRESPQAYGSSRAAVAGFFSLPFSGSPVLALSARGEVVSGDAPVHRAAFIGGRHTLRGFSQGRFVGDAAASGTAELRVPLFPAKLAARGTVGASGFADGGRVWFDGSSEGGWHTATGGAIWFTSPLYTVSAEAAFGETDAVYLRLGVGL